MPRNDWTEEELAYLRANYHEHGPRGLARHEAMARHRNYSSIAHKARELGLTTVIGPYGRRRDDGEQAEG